MSVEGICVVACKLNMRDEGTADEKRTSTSSAVARLSPMPTRTSWCVHTMPGAEYSSCSRMPTTRASVASVALYCCTVTRPGATRAAAFVRVMGKIENALTVIAAMSSTMRTALVFAAA